LRRQGLTASDIFGEKISDKNVPFSKIDIKKSGVSVYAITSGTVTKIEKTSQGVSFWINGNDGYNYYYKGLSEVSVNSEEAVKTGAFIGKTGSEGLYIAVTRDGYGSDITAASNIQSYRSRKIMTDSGIQTEIYTKGGISFFNPAKILNSAKVIRQCSTAPNPNISLGSIDNDGLNVTVNAEISDPNSKNVTVEFRIRKVGEENPANYKSSDIHLSSWPLSKWKKSGSSFQYTFKGLEAGQYEWSARAMNEDGVYSSGVTFGTESINTQGSGVAFSSALAADSSQQVSSDGFAPVETFSVGDITDSGKEIVYYDSFSSGLKVGTDNTENCCYAVLPSTQTFEVVPNTGKYGIYVVADLTGGNKTDREVTFYDGVDDATKKIVATSTATYYTVGQNNYTDNQFVTSIDSNSAPWNEKTRNVRIRIKNPENVTSDPTFVIREFFVNRPAQSSSTTTTIAGQTTTSSSSTTASTTTTTYPKTTIMTTTKPAAPTFKSNYLSDVEIAQLAYYVGFRDDTKGNNLQIAFAVCLAESDGYTKSINHNTDGSIDYGLWQINDTYNKEYLDRYNNEWKDPIKNGRMAYDTFKDRGWRDWTSYKKIVIRNFFLEPRLLSANFRLRSTMLLAFQLSK
jgi:hypothetical protein